MKKLQVLIFVVGIHISDDRGCHSLDPILSRRNIMDHAMPCNSPFLHRVGNCVHVVLYDPPPCFCMEVSFPERQGHCDHCTWKQNPTFSWGQELETWVWCLHPQAWAPSQSNDRSLAEPDLKGPLKYRCSSKFRFFLERSPKKYGNGEVWCIVSWSKPSAISLNSFSYTKFLPLCLDQKLKS